MSPLIRCTMRVTWAVFRSGQTHKDGFHPTIYACKYWASVKSHTAIYWGCTSASRSWARLQNHLTSALGRARGNWHTCKQRHDRSMNSCGDVFRLVPKAVHLQGSARGPLLGDLKEPHNTILSFPANLTSKSTIEPWMPSTQTKPHHSSNNKNYTYVCKSVSLCECMQKT